MADSDRIAAQRELLNDGYDQPHEVADVQVVFPADLGTLLPKWTDIPENFRDYGGDAESRPWKVLQARWFFSGLKKSSITPHPGVDLDKALRHLKVLQGSFEPKHEHKEAAVAWLASRWFEAVDV